MISTLLDLNVCKVILLYLNCLLGDFTLVEPRETVFLVTLLLEYFCNCTIWADFGKSTTLSRVKSIEPSTLCCCYSSTHTAIKIFQWISGNSWYRLILCSLQCWLMLCNALFDLEIFKVSNVTKWLIFQNLVTYIGWLFYYSISIAHFHILLLIVL